MRINTDNVDMIESWTILKGVQWAWSKGGENSKSKATQ